LVCDPSFGCVQGAFAESPEALYLVELPSGALTRIGPTGAYLFDIALETDGTLYGVGEDALWTVDTTTGTSTRVSMVPNLPLLNALDAAPDGTLFGFTCQGLVLSLDTATGKGTELAATGAMLYGASSR
jgi:hypothetical protein